MANGGRRERAYIAGWGPGSGGTPAAAPAGRASAVQLLASAPLFRGLSPDELGELFREVRHRQFPPGSTFHQPGDELEVLYFLKRGRVRVYRLTPSGRKVILTELRSPTAFGSMALLGQGMDSDFAETVEESLICTVSRQTLERLLRRRPDLALRLLAVLGRRLWELERRFEEMATLTAEQRLAAILLRLADATTGAVEGFTQEELAEMSGTIRQTVARILAGWQRVRLVEVRRRSVRIVLREKLAALAAGRRA